MAGFEPRGCSGFQVSGMIDGYFGGEMFNSGIYRQNNLKSEDSW